MSLKILFLSHSFYPNIGGIEANSEILASAFAEAGHTVRLLTWSPDTTGKVFPYKIIRKPGILQLVKEHAWADIVFENNPCMRLAWLGFFYKRPTVIALNTWISYPNNLAGKIKFWWLKRAQKIIAVSNAVRSKCWTSAIVITNPYNVEQFKRINDTEKTMHFVFLGRLVSDKGADQAIEALNRILTSKHGTSKATDISLTIIGDGPERSKLEQTVSTLQLQNYVKFTGALSGQALATQLNRYRFMLVPSVWEEPFGNVVLEGMACGCLPIVSNGGGLPDAVGKAGLVFQRGNIDAMVACMKMVLDNPVIEQQLRAAAPTHLAAHDPRIVSRKYLDVIETAASLN